MTEADLATARGIVLKWLREWCDKGMGNYIPDDTEMLALQEAIAAALQAQRERDAAPGP